MKLKLNWEEFGEYLRTLISGICHYNQLEPKDRKINKVVGIANGGLYVSVPIAIALQVPHESVKITFRHGRTSIKNINYQYKEGENILLVDDVIDSGKTLATFKRKFNNGKIYVAALCNKTELDVDFYTFVTDKWVIFPWETQE